MPHNEIAKKTKLFASPNRYSAFANAAESDDNDDLPQSHSQESSDTKNLTKVSLPPPIFFYQRRIKLLRPNLQTYGTKRAKQLRM